MATITIFHTGDMHNRLTPEKARQLSELKSSEENSILLDSGDAIWAGNIFYRRGGEPILELMNSTGYDTMAMGNREFHFSRSGFRAKTRLAEFPILCANVTSMDGSELPVRPYVILERGGLRIAVFGLCAPMITKRSFGSVFSIYRFEDPIQRAADLVPQLRREADLVIALTHIGLDRDRELAARAPGIDLILGGHTHIEAMERTNTPIIHTGSHAKKVGKAVLETGSGLKSWELLEW